MVENQSNESLSEDVQILILAGGYSERFDKEKAFLEVGGKPLIRHVVDRISSLAEKIVISCKTGTEELEEQFPEAEIVPDKYAKSGPLVGLVSSLPSIELEHVAVVTCDCPKINPEVLRTLFMKAEGHDGVVPRWPEGYIEPLQAVYRSERLVRAVSMVWENDRMKIGEVLRLLSDVVYVSTEELRKIDPKLESFFNLNSLEDLERLREDLNET